MAFPTDLTNAVDDSSPGVHDGTPIVAAHLNSLEAKVGIDSSAVATSLDYLLKNAASINPGHKHSKLWASDGSPEAVDVLADGTVDIFKTTTSVANAREDTLAAQLTLTPSGALGASAARLAASGYVTIPASNTQNMVGVGSNGAVQGVRGLVENNSASGTVAELIGTYGGVWIGGAANTTTKMSGLYGSVYADLGGTVGTMAACTLWAGVEPGAAAAVTNLMGLYIEGIDSVVGVVNRYGIYIPAFGGVAPTTNDYAIYSAATQPSYLAGRLGICKTAPVYTLHVYGDSGVEGTGGTIGIIPGSATVNPTYGNFIYGRNAADDAYQNIGIKTAVGTPGYIFDTNWNFSIGTDGVVGTSAQCVLAIGYGVTPTTAPANIAQIWSENINGATGFAGLHKMTETTAQKEVVPGVIIKTDTGSPTNPYEGLMEINTYDNKIRMYGDAGWRELGTW